MSGTRIFASFDVVHDGDLYERLVGDSGNADLGIVVTGGSEPFAMSDGWGERARREIRGVDRLLVICGEYTDASMGVASELRIAQEEEKPYVLLWGRRESMCTKPSGAKPTEGMYGWTTQILREQLAMMSRLAGESTASATLQVAGPSALPDVDADDRSGV